MNFYRNSLIYITGGSSGIGYAVADAVLSKGARVVLIARDKKKLAEAQESLSNNKPERFGKISISMMYRSGPFKKGVPLAVQKNSVSLLPR